MRSRKALNELVPPKDDDQRQPDERPRVLSSEYRHGDRKIEIRKSRKANSPSELMCSGYSEDGETKSRRPHVARPVTIDPHQTALCIEHSAGIRMREGTRQGHVFIYVRVLPPMVWFSTLQIFARAGLATRHGQPSKSSCSRNGGVLPFVDLESDLRGTTGGLRPAKMCANRSEPDEQRCHQVPTGGAQSISFQMYRCLRYTPQGL